jgi:hypothetical protein
MKRKEADMALRDEAFGAQREIVERLAELARERTSGRALADVCVRLGIDVDRVHQRAHARRADVHEVTDQDIEPELEP